MKVQGSLSRTLPYAKEPAAEAAIHRIMFFAHDINFDANVKMMELLTEKGQENKMLKN